MKTLKVEAVYPFEPFADVIENPPRFIDAVYNSRRLHSCPWLFKLATVRGLPHPADGQISSLIPVRPEGPTPLRTVLFVQALRRGIRPVVLPLLIASICSVLK
jgi:hypothetical protein